MKRMNVLSNLLGIINNRKGLLILCLSLATFGVNDAWGKSAIGKTAVYQGLGGSATVEIWTYKLIGDDTRDDSKTTTGSDLVQVSGEASLKKYRYLKFIHNTNSGYTFNGWFTNAGCTGSASSTSDIKTDNITGDKTYTYYAKFTPNTNTAYTVKHYKQNLAGTGYDLVETENLTGTTDTKVTPARKSYTGFATPEGQEVNIDGNGSRVVEYYYTRNSYTLTWNLDGGSITTAGTPAGSVKYEATLTAPEVSKVGAQFKGWSPEVPATMPAENVTYTAQWVSKYNIEVTGSDQNMKVGGTQENAFNFVHAENPVSHISVGSLDPINNGDGQVIEYDAANNKIIAHNAGTATIYFTQAGTETMYESTSASFTYTVTKNDNHISINNSQDSYAASIYMDAQQSINLTATNIDYSGSPITATQTAGNTIATLNTAQTQVTSNHNLGDATWTVSQPENYKYKAANASFTIHVVTEAEATDCYVLEDNSERKWDTNGNSGSYGPFSAAGATLHFEIKRTAIFGVTNTKNLYAEYSADGSNWSHCSSEINLQKEDVWYPLSYSLPETAKYVRFITEGLGATGNKHVRNVRVTRKTYLNADDFTINTQENNTTLVYPGDKGTGSFQVDYSLANGGDLKLVCDNPKFTIDKTTQTDVDCKTGSFNVDMTYTSQTAGTDYAHVVIYNNVYRKEITVTGITQKHQQTLKWKENFDQMSKGGEEKNAATSSHGLVTYISSKPDVIRVDNDANGNATILVAIAKGEAKITATAAGDEEYEEKSIEKTISVTEKCVQYIVWTQSLMGLKLGDPNRVLNAYATSEIEECTSNNGGRLVIYTSADESVVKVVNTNQLQIVGVGTTTVTARQEGGLDSDGHEYEPATKENTVVVKDPSAKCEAFVYEQNGDAEEFFAMNTSEIKGTEHTLNGEPAKLTFRAKREYWKLVVDYSKGKIVVDAYTPTGNWQQVLDCGEPPIGSYKEYSVNLNRDVTKIRFRRPDEGQGYHYIADAKIERARYIETTTPATFQANVGEVQQQTIYLSYSNITDNILLSMAGGANSHFSVDKTQISGNCGDIAKNIALTILYAPTTNTEELGEETETLIISDGTTVTNVALKGVANRVARSIAWDIDNQNTAYTVQTFELNAIAETNLHQKAGTVAYNIVSQTSTEGCGTINNNVLSFAKAGNVSVIATTIEDTKYFPAIAVTKSWIVSKTPTQVTTKPTISGDIISGTDMASLILNGGAVQNNVNNQPVEGTFAVTAGDLVNVGEQPLTVTFTPNNTDMYEGCTTTITANVVQREATAEEKGTPSAAPITYSNAINTSVLSGNGTLAGTWSWVDEEANKATPNVGTVDNLNVIFTPNDGNVKQATNTVSLTVTAATPTLTWTATPEAAQVHETKTFTASSTNTDNTAAITYSIISGSECATINETTGEVTMTKAGTITVQASQVATTNFNAPEPIKMTCTISLAPTSITTKPTTDNIVSGTSLSEVVLTGGEAQNTINNQAVEGTFAVTAGETTAVGEQTLTITFAPTEADKYASCTTTISATVIQRTPTQEEVGTPSAADIEYGAAVNTSVLTGNGTLEGTWSWIDNRKDDVLPVGTHDGLQVRFTPIDGNVHTVDAVVSLTITGEMENKFIGDGDWNVATNWTNGVPTGENPNIVVSGRLTIHEPISIGGLTIEQSGEVNIVNDGDLTVNGTSSVCETYGNLFVRNGGNITIHENAEVKVYDFVVESSIGTQNGTNISGQVENSNKVIYTNGAYIDINMDPDGSMDDTQWYGFTVPFPVDVQNGVARKEGDTFRKCTYGSDYMIAEYDMQQRLNTGKGWKYIKTGKLQPGHFYYFTVNGNYNTYSFKAAETQITIQTETAITTNGDGANANWNAVGNSTLMYAKVSGENLPAYVQTYVNGESRYQVVSTTDAQFVVGCPFFIQATAATTMVLNKATEMQDILHYAPRSEETAQPICVRIAEEGQRFSDQMYITASEDALDSYELGRDLAKAGIGTKSAQLWVNAYKQSLCVNDAPLIDKKAYYDITLYAPKAGMYELTLPRIPNNGTLYLTQNGMPIWNLNESAYSIECAKGNNSEYGLLFIESEQSGDGSMTNNQTIDANTSWQKVMVNQHVYILQNGSVYDITGQKVK